MHLGETDTVTPFRHLARIVLKPHQEVVLAVGFQSNASWMHLHFSTNPIYLRRLKCEWGQSFIMGSISVYSNNIIDADQRIIIFHLPNLQPNGHYYYSMLSLPNEKECKKRHTIAVVEEGRGWSTNSKPAAQKYISEPKTALHRLVVLWWDFFTYRQRAAEMHFPLQEGSWKLSKQLFIQRCHHYLWPGACCPISWGQTTLWVEKWKTL